MRTKAPISSSALGRFRLAILTFATTLVSAILLCSGEVFAATTSTFGDLLCNAKLEMNAYPTLISAVSYTIGAFLSVRGVLYLAQRFGAQDDGQGGNTTKGIAHLLGGGALLSAPTFASILQNSLYIGSNGATMSSACTPGAVATLASGLGLDQVMMNFSKNISHPMFMLMAAISIAMGIFLIVRGLIKAAKYGMDPRSDNVKNIVTNLFIGAILISIGDILPVAMTTIFGVASLDDINSFAGLNWSSLGLPASSTVAADNALKAGLAFVQVVGGIAFVRGWLMIKNAIEGTAQQTVPQGLTHVIGGAMAINIGTMLKIIDNTFGTGMVL